jgi:hypothetical protein
MPWCYIWSLASMSAMSSPQHLGPIWHVAFCFVFLWALGGQWAMRGWSLGAYHMMVGRLSGAISIESLCMWCIVFTYNYSPYLKWKYYFYFSHYFKFWLILLSILCNMPSSIVCYCLYHIWIVVSWLFILDVEAWLVQIPIFELKKLCIWALIPLKVEIVVICQFLLRILVLRINSHIKSPYIVKLPVCYGYFKIMDARLANLVG